MAVSLNSPPCQGKINTPPTPSFLLLLFFGQSSPVATIMGSLISSSPATGTVAGKYLDEKFKDLFFKNCPDSL